MTLRLNLLYRRAMKRISRRFVNGLLVLVPVVITLLVIEWTLRFTEGVLGQYLPFYFPGMGIITLVLIIYLAGWASTNWVLAKLISLGENMIGTIPFVKFIYTSVKRLSEAVLDPRSNFKRVVHVPYQGARALGFVMADLPPRFQEAMGGGYAPRQGGGCGDDQYSEGGGPPIYADGRRRHAACRCEREQRTEKCRQALGAL